MRAAEGFYTTKQWRDARDAYIKERIAIDGGLCERCHSSVGYIVHHRTHLTSANKSDYNITVNQKNLQFVCLECHNSIHYGKHNCKFLENGQPVDTRDI